jgi:trimeric autotransporter adhesin
MGDACIAVIIQQELTTTALGRLIVCYANTTGTNNTAVGRSTLRCNTTGGRNTAVGRQALLNQNTAGCL